MQQLTTINYWKQYHDALHSDTAKACKGRIEAALNMCQSAFYRKIKDPQRYLCIAEKLAIAKVYQLKPVYLFPELLKDNAGLLD